MRTFAAELVDAHPHIHLLVNCAGASPDEPGARTHEGFGYVVGVNFIAPLVLSHLLLDALRAGAQRAGVPSRIVNVLSVLEAVGVVQWDDLGDLSAPANGMAAYATSKRQLALASVHMAARLRGGGVDVVAAQPGFTASRFYDKVCAFVCVCVCLRACGGML
jgi:NAD(P)-dependent dehydrogenase (short-subunit alcohol dehydrogenase family)